MRIDPALRRTSQTLGNRIGRGISPGRRALAVALLAVGLLLTALSACDLASELPVVETPSESAVTSTRATLPNNWIKLAPAPFFPPVAFDSVIVSLGSGGGAAAGRSNANDAGFATPGGIAVQADGPVYVSDMTLGTVQSIDPVKWALQDSEAAAGREAVSIGGDLVAPSRLIVDGRGRLIIATLDRIELIEPSQAAIVVAGNGEAGFAGDGGTAANAQFNGNSGMAIDSEGNLLVADRGNGRLRRIDASGIVSTIAGTGDSASTGDGGPAVEASLDKPVDVAVGPDGSIFVAELGGHRIRRIGRDGIINTYTGIGIAGFSGDGGPAVEASLNSPRAIEVDSEGNLYIADWRNNVLRRVAVDGSIRTVAGLASEGALREGRPAFAVALPPPLDMALGPEGTLYLLLQGARTVYLLRPPSGAQATDECDGAPSQPDPRAPLIADGVALIVAGDADAGFAGDGGPISEARFAIPQSFAIADDGRIFVADSGNHRIRVISTGGEVSTFAGTGEPGYSGDGGEAGEARLSGPKAIEVDARGNVFFFDSGNFRIRRIDRCGIIETVAGSGEPGSDGDGGPALIASFRDVSGLAFDNRGNLYAADPASNRVRVISRDGFISSFAGTGQPESGADGGPAANTPLDGPADVARHSDGSMLIAEQRAGKIRRVSAFGEVTTLVGPGAVDGEFEGPLDQVRVQDPVSLVTDADGNVYLAQLTAGLVSKIAPDGAVTIVAGNPAGTGVPGDPAVDVALPAPLVIQLDGRGNLYVLESAGLLWRAGAG